MFCSDMINKNNRTLKLILWFLTLIKLLVLIFLFFLNICHHYFNNDYFIVALDEKLKRHMTCVGKRVADTYYKQPKRFSSK